MMISHTSTLFLLSFIFTTFISLSSSSKFSTQYSILGPDLDKRPSQDEAIQLFQQWKKHHGRVYTGLQEMAKRFDIFISNMNYIIEFNSKRSSPSSHRLGLNKFADLSPREIKETYSRKLERPRDSSIKMRDDLPCNAPERLDWRKKGAVTEVKYQDVCLSCWAFAAVGSIEGINAIVNGRLDSLSEQHVLDCNTVSNCDTGGWPYEAFDWVISNGGIASEADYPYDAAVESSCRGPDKVTNIATIDGYEQVAISDNALMCATAIQPVSVCMITEPSMEFDFYDAGIFNGGECPKNATHPDHCMLLVGYDSKFDVTGVKNYWIVKNSYGDDWGMEGYMWIKRDPDLPYGVCAILLNSHVPIINEGISATLKPSISSM